MLKSLIKVLSDFAQGYVVTSRLSSWWSGGGWVWSILAYLIFVGMRARQTRIVSAYQLCIIPVIFLLMRFRIFFTGTIDQILTYILFLSLGSVVGFLWAQRSPVRIFTAERLVEIPGSNKTLILFLGFFSVKFFLV